MAPYHGTVEVIRGHAYNARAARTASNRCRHFQTDFLSRLNIPDILFLHQSLSEMVDLFAMYVVHLGMGHTLLAKSIKSETIRRYINEAGTSVLERRQIHQRKFPQVQFTWFHPCRNHGESKAAPTITACLDEIKRWENMPNRREPLTIDMIYHQQGKII